MIGSKVIGSINVLDEAKKTTIGTLRIELKGMRRFRFRSWLSVLLIKAAVAVCPSHIDVEHEQ